MASDRIMEHYYHNLQHNYIQNCRDQQKGLSHSMGAFDRPKTTQNSFLTEAEDSSIYNYSKLNIIFRAKQ
ncbi:hypothetical protein KFK09_003186 [Dendrobium nobile]|uniref:Uncharacterized protein n=1 Tax=Dendrobium nobile TaxID=94219 RepID=A0A8T3C3H3_DENNO|nr:hypothetical protein KFK09_003186 [Dendrobium nobile]